jgi:hypothetical protein
MDLINYNITNIGQNGDYNTSFIIDKCQNKINNENELHEIITICKNEYNYKKTMSSEIT